MAADRTRETRTGYSSQHPTGHSSQHPTGQSGFRNLGVPHVEVGVGVGTAHAADQYTTVETLIVNAAIYAQLPRHFQATSLARVRGSSAWSPPDSGCLAASSWSERCLRHFE